MQYKCSETVSSLTHIRLHISLALKV